MTTQERLISALSAKFPNATAAEIARKVGSTPQRWNNYTTNKRSMDDDAILGCAIVLGLDQEKTLAAHRRDIARTTRERTFWARIAAVLTLAVIGALPHQSKAAAPYSENGLPASVDYVKLLRWFRAALAAAKRLAGSGLAPCG